MTGDIMALDAGEEFNLMATPSQALLRKLAYLAQQGNDSVLTGSARSGKSAVTKGADGAKAEQAHMLLQMARLADPGYQALSAQINADLDLMDEASVHALQDIEEELTELRRQREKILEQAYHDESGRRIFMRADGTGAYYEDGTELDNDEFTQRRDRLQGKPTWDSWQDLTRREVELGAERDKIHAHDAERQKLRDDLAAGRISKEEAKLREEELERTAPDRVRQHYNSLTSAEGTSSTASFPALKADEFSQLDSYGQANPNVSTSTGSPVGHDPSLPGPSAVPGPR